MEEVERQEEQADREVDRIMAERDKVMMMMMMMMMMTMMADREVNRREGQGVMANWRCLYMFMFFGIYSENCYSAVDLQ